MSRTLIKESGTSAIACADSWGPFSAKYKLKYIAVKLDAAATTSEALTVTINSATGAAYDTIIVSDDLSIGSKTSFLYRWDSGFDICKGDVLDLAYTNTDTNTVLWVAYIDPQPAD